MNHEALKRLAENAKAFAAAYVRVKEELTREGVPPDEASEVARNAVNLAAMVDGKGEGPPWE